MNENTNDIDMTGKIWVIEDKSEDDLETLKLAVHIDVTQADKLSAKQACRSYECIINILKTITAELDSNREFSAIVSKMLDDGEIVETKTDDGTFVLELPK